MSIGNLETEGMDASKHSWLVCNTMLPSVLFLVYGRGAFVDKVYALRHCIMLGDTINELGDQRKLSWLWLELRNLTSRRTSTCLLMEMASHESASIFEQMASML